MINFIPHHIANSFSENKIFGEMSVKSLFLDISGFTKMTEQLMKNGKDGAEALSKIINSVFEPILQEIYSNEGFITTFAGDAFTAIFPDSPSLDFNKVRNCAMQIMAIFTNNPMHKTLWGEFFLEVKIGLSGGNVKWGILEESNSLGYFFKGDAIDDCADAEHHCRPGFIAMQKSLGYTLPKEAQEITDISTDYIIFKPGRIIISENLNVIIPDISSSIVERFLPVNKFPDSTLGEFRNIVSVFILFDENKIKLGDMFSSLINGTKESGGFLNLLDFGDKGGVALVLFGAPLSLEQKENRAFDFALKLQTIHSSLKIGVAGGPCFTGYVGNKIRSTYTALGETVNLSARLAISCKNGQTLLPSELFKKQNDDFIIENLEDRTFKGISDPISVSILKSKKNKKQNLTLSQGVGRINELQTLKKWTESTINGNKTKAFVISGETGIGKSQLVSDVFNPLKNEISYIIFQFDTIFQKSFGPLRHYFIELFNEIKKEDNDLEESFKVKLGELLTDSTPDFIKNEIKRVIPPLFNLAGVKVIDKDFINLDAQAKHDRTIEALAAYFSLIALKKPSIYIIDQAQSMDKESKDFFKLLFTHTNGMSLGIIYLMRENEIDHLDVPIDNHIILKQFSTEELIMAVKREYNAEPEKGLLKFIEKRTNNIPLYLFALLSFLQKKDLININHGNALLKKIGNVTLPESLEDLILNQIDSLPKELKTTLPFLSVLGNIFPKTIAEKMIKKSSDSIFDELIKYDILSEDSDNNFIFQKEIIRDAVYQLQLNNRLRSLHELAAKSWVDIYPNVKEYSQEKAYHFRKAEKLTEARDYYLHSAEYSAKNFFNGTALEQYEQFIKLSNDEAKNSLINLKMAQILELTGEWNSALEQLVKGIGLATMSDEKSLYHKFFNLLGQIKFRQGESSSAKKYFEKAIIETVNSKIDPDIVQTRIDLARVHIVSGRSDDAMSRLQEAKEMAITNNFLKEEGLALYYLGQVLSSHNKKKEAQKNYNRSLEIFRKLKISRLIANPLYDLSLMAQNEGQLDLSRKQMQEAMDLYVQIGYKSGIAAALLNLGLMEDQVGEFTKGRDFFRRSRNIAEELGEHLGVGYAQFCQGASAFKGGELAQAINYLEEAHKIFVRLNADSYMGYTLSYMTSVLVRLGRSDEAISTALEQMKIIKSTGVDVEKGRTFLSIAELLEHNHNLDKTSLNNLQTICELADIDKATPGRFYRISLIAAKDAHYVNTWIPGLVHFGEYLIKLNRKEIGLKYIKRAHEESLRSSWKYFANKLEKKYPNILFLSANKN